MRHTFFRPKFSDLNPSSTINFPPFFSRILLIHCHQKFTRFALWLCTSLIDMRMLDFSQQSLQVRSPLLWSIWKTLWKHFCAEIYIYTNYGSRFDHASFTSLSFFLSFFRSLALSLSLSLCLSFSLSLHTVRRLQLHTRRVLKVKWTLGERYKYKYGCNTFETVKKIKYTGIF